MAESYSVKAVLSAVDRGFSSTFKNCLGTLNSINSKISGMAFGFLSGAGTAAFNAITGSVGGLVSEINSSSASWKTFAKNMEIVEKSGGKLEMSTEKVKNELQDFAQKTVYSSSDMASTYAQLAAVGTKNTLELVKGFGGLAAAAENPQQAMKTLSTQATQMAAKPKVAWADFKLMLEQSPAGIAAVAKEMGMSTAEMVSAVQEGEVSTNKFFDAIIKAGGAGTEFEKLATEAKTVGQAMDGLKETIGNKLLPSFNLLSQLGINAINGIADKLAGLDFGNLPAKLGAFIGKIRQYFEVAFEAFSGVGSVVADALGSVGDAITSVTGEFGSTESITGFKKVMQGVANVLKNVFGFIKDNAGAFETVLSSGISIAKGIWESFSGSAKKVGGAVMDLVNYILANSGVFMDILGAGVQAIKPYWDAFVNVLTWAIGIIKKIATVIVEHADAVKTLIPWVLGAVAAFKGFKVVKTVLPFISGFATKLGGMAKTLAGGIANKLFGVSKAQQSVGKSSAASGTSMLQAAGALALMGVAVVLVATGFALLTQSAIALAEAGPLAIGVMAGLVVALAALGLGMGVLLKTLAPMGAQMLQVSVAMLAMGAAVLLVSTGFALLAQSSIALANAGTPAILVMVGMVAAIALLAIGAAALAPALTAGAVGLIAFGAAMTLCAVAAVLAATSLVILSTCLPTLAEYGLQGALAIATLGAAMIAFGAGAIVAGAGAVVLAAGLVVLAAGIVVASAAVVVLSAAVVVLSAATLVLTAAVLALSVGVIALGASLLLVGASFALINGLLPTTATGALLVTTVFTALLAVSLLLTASLTLLNVPLVLIGASSLVAGAGMLVFGVGLTTASAGALLLGAALKTVESRMKTIVSSAERTKTALNSMEQSVKIVENGLNALGSKAKEAMNQLKDAFDNTAKNAKTAGKNIGTWFAEQMQIGLKKAVENTKTMAEQIKTVLEKAGVQAKQAGQNLGNGFVQSMTVTLALSKMVATNATTSVVSILNRGRGGAYGAGANISAGFAAGMQACLGQIQAAAAAMVAAAEAAIRAKAMIHSPSKLTEKLGNYFGEGFEGGIEDMFGGVQRAAQKLVSIPQVETPQLAFAGGYGYELSGEYDYYRNNEYVIEVPLSVDGREFARATASYTEEELNRKQSRDYRKQGRI